MREVAEQPAKAPARGPKTPAQRAALALGTSKTEKHLVKLATKHTAIVEIKDKAGRDQAHGAAMELMRARTTIVETAKTAREDATKFSQAVITEERRLIAIVTAEETRLKGLRDAWDTEQERIKREKEEANRKRLLAIGERITEIKNYLTLASNCRTSERMQGLIDKLTAVPIEGFDEFADDAAAAKHITLVSIANLFTAKVEAEVEAKRVADEKAALAQQKAEQEARQRKLDDQAAEIERQRMALVSLRQPAPAEEKPAIFVVTGTAQPAPSKCDGNHAGAPCTDPACWNGGAPAADRIAADLLTRTTAPAVQAAMQEQINTGTGILFTQIVDGVAIVRHVPTSEVRLQRPTDDAIIDAISAHFRVHEFVVISWLQDMDLQAASQRLVTEFS